MPLTILVKTWLCDKCPYSWQFSGEAASTTPYDLSLPQLREQFPEPQFFGLLPGKCPSCWLRGQSGNLYLSDDESKMSTIYVATDEELEAITKPDTDPNGDVIKEKVDERETLGIVDGKPSVVTEDIYAEKHRELTEDELRELKQQRDESLDKLDAIAVKEAFSAKEG